VNVRFCFRDVKNSLSKSLCNILSDERMVLSYTIVAGPRQRSHSQVLVPLDSRPYFTVSESGLPQNQGNRVSPPGFFSSSPNTRRATVEVFDPASTRSDN
jgi:hypothetical protein